MQDSRMEDQLYINCNGVIWCAFSQLIDVDSNEKIIVKSH